MSRTLCRTAAVFSIVLLAAFSTFQQLPDVAYTTTSSVKIAGAAGRALNFLARVGGTSTDVTETLYVKGNKMLRHGKEQSTLVDLDAEQMITIDHKRKSYSVVTFDEWKQRISDMAERMEDGSTDGPSKDDVPEPAETSDAEFKVDFSVDRTGVKNSIAGQSAEKYFMTVRIDASQTIAEEGKPAETHEGTLVLASELWLSTAIKGYEEVEAFNRRFAERLGDTIMSAAETKSLADALQQAYAGDPRIKEALEKAQVEAEKMEGVEVKNTTHIVLLAQGATFDADAIFGVAEVKEEKKKKGGLMGRIAKQVAAQATGTEQTSSSEAEEPASQQVLMTITTETSNWSTETIPATAFEIPAGYKLVNDSAGR